MTGETPDKPTEPAPSAPQAMHVSDKPVEPVSWRLFWPQPKTVRHVVVEVFIVAVGVLLALGIDQLRQHFSRMAQAEETRRLLTTEMRRNLEGVEAAMPRLAGAYSALGVDPGQARAIFGSGRMGTSPLFDTAYDLAVQNGTLSYLGPGESAAIADIYRGQRLSRDNAEKYADALRQLASYQTGSIADNGEALARTRQGMLAQVFATSLFRDQCRQVIRLSAALDEPRSDKDPMEYCSGISPSADVDAVIAGRYEPPATDAPPQPEEPN